MGLKLRPWADFAGALILILGADFALFHRGAYFQLLEPNSHSGNVRRSVARLDRAKELSGAKPLVLFMGNSQTQQGMQEGLFERRLKSAGFDVRAVNLAQGGSSPPAWRLLLDSYELADGRTKAVVLGVGLTTFRDPVWRDIEIAKTQLRMTQAPWVAGLFPDFEESVKGLAVTIFRLPLFAPDVRRLLADPGKRQEAIETSAKMWRRLNRKDRRPDNRSLHDLTAARLDEAGKLVVAELPEPLRRNRQVQIPIERALLKSRSQPGRGLPFNSARAARVFEDLLRDLGERGIGVFVTILPTSAYNRQHATPRPILDIVSKLQGEGLPLGLFYDGDLLRVLEQPEYFQDIVHLNRKGADLFTGRVAAEVAGWLAANETDQN